MRSCCNVMPRGMARMASVEKNASDTSSCFNRIVNSGGRADSGSGTFHRAGTSGYVSSSSRKRAAVPLTPSAASRCSACNSGPANSSQLTMN